MLRYRVAYDPEKGHFVLPTLSVIVPHSETFTSRAAAQRVAQARDAMPADPSAEEDFEPLGDNSPFLQAFLRRTSA